MDGRFFFTSHNTTLHQMSAPHKTSITKHWNVFKRSIVCKGLTLLTAKECLAWNFQHWQKSTILLETHHQFHLHNQRFFYDFTQSYSAERLFVDTIYHRKCDMKDKLVLKSWAVEGHQCFSWNRLHFWQLLNQRRSFWHRHARQV